MASEHDIELVARIGDGGAAGVLDAGAHATMTATAPVAVRVVVLQARR